MKFPQAKTSRGLLSSFATCCLVFSLNTPTCADGWHNAALSTSSLDQWLNDVRQMMNSNNRSSGGKSKGSFRSGSSKNLPNARGGRSARGALTGGVLPKRLTPEQQALLGRKSADCLEVLAFMSKDNIIPREFPSFKLGAIPQYRSAARELLTAMGPYGGNAVVGQLRAELMGSGKSGLRLHESYFKDLTAVLKESIKSGDVDPKQLESLIELIMSTGNQANPALQPLLDELINGSDFATLVGLVEQLKGTKLQRKIRLRMEKVLKDQSELQLLIALDVAQSNRVVQTVVEKELRSRSPRFADVKDDIDGIARLYSDSRSSVVKRESEAQIVNAFLRAPMTDCLHTIGKSNSKIDAIIWAQIDDRIGRADQARRDSYGDASGRVLARKNETSGAIEAALTLVEKLNDKKHARHVIKALPSIPKEHLGTAGRLLRKVTGQDFGPKQGDDFSKVFAAYKKWQEWLSRN